MSIDYSDMAFPKPGKKKKRKIHKKSILNSQKGICYLCARLNGDYSVKQTEEQSYPVRGRTKSNIRRKRVKSRPMH